MAACLLAAAFPEAEVTAVDGTPELLARRARRAGSAARRGRADRAAAPRGRRRRR
ncbi:hypothetical protein [Saccharopolyspora shandongensis]|uniref:hypothetical protein n=1 Tax=Saccharopolyspora shandongensis TaxID=418495 RepID=UPI0033E1E250